uniref:Putative secreted protein n=1 Tax=Lutzomyia longipalpis TaxID=7200 RepID=A0A1B0FUZ8_LUTLO
MFHGKLTIGALLYLSLLKFCENSPLMSNRRPPIARNSGMNSLMLPSNATSIRADISDGFSCENRDYGYYADVANDCQIFHVCLPVMFANQRKSRTYQWSFICPEETLFSQDAFTCVRAEDMTIRCEESEKFYDLNGKFGGMMEGEEMGQFRDVTTTARVEATTTAAEDPTSPPTMQTMKDEGATNESDVRFEMNEDADELGSSSSTSEMILESQPLNSMPDGSESILRNIESIVDKAARDLERVNGTAPLTRTKRKGQRRRFLFAADA